jgi:hypothetical protein
MSANSLAPGINAVDNQHHIARKKMPASFVLLHRIPGRLKKLQRMKSSGRLILDLTRML